MAATIKRSMPWICWICSRVDQMASSLQVEVVMESTWTIRPWDPPTMGKDKPAFRLLHFSEAPR
jgi:hypothetical protein